MTRKEKANFTVRVLVVLSFAFAFGVLLGGQSAEGRAPVAPVGPIIIPMQMILDDPTVITTGASQVIGSWCYHEPQQFGTAFASSVACKVPNGWSVTIRTTELIVLSSTLPAATHQCRVGLAVGESAPVTMESWAATDVGEVTTPSCDVLTGTGALDVAGESCKNEDPTGTTIAAGGSFWLAIDEADSGTPACTSIRAMEYWAITEWLRVP